MQPEILITGGTGLLGNHLSQILRNNGIPHHVASRSNGQGLPNWVQLDFDKGMGIETAVSGKKTIFHLASATRKPSAKVDVEGTRKLMDAAKSAGVSHVLFISIVGIDKVPIEYYKIKLMTEKVVAGSGVPFTILRATQFHNFGDFMLSAALKYPVGVLPKYAKFQPIGTDDVASRLYGLSMQPPRNQTLNIGGPKVWSLNEITAAWLKSRKERKFLLNLPPFNKALKALRDGGLTCAEISDSSIGWEEWLRGKYG